MTNLIHYDGDTDHWVGKSGVREYAYTDALSLDGNGEMAYGHDGGFEVEAFPREERIALANLMIARWEKYRDAQ